MPARKPQSEPAQRGMKRVIVKAAGRAAVRAPRVQGAGAARSGRRTGSRSPSRVLVKVLGGNDAARLNQVARARAPHRHLGGRRLRADLARPGHGVSERRRRAGTCRGRARGGAARDRRSGRRSKGVSAQRSWSAPRVQLLAAARLPEGFLLRPGDGARRAGVERPVLSRRRSHPGAASRSITARAGPERRREVPRRRRPDGGACSTRSLWRGAPRARAAPRRTDHGHLACACGALALAARRGGVTGLRGCADRALDDAVGRARVLRRNPRPADRRRRGRVRGGKRLRSARARRPRASSP